MSVQLTRVAQAKAIWDYLYDIFATEQARGASGRLATLARVQRSIDFYTTETPVLGVQPVGMRYKSDYAQRQLMYSVEMIIGLGAASSETVSGGVIVPQNLETAMYDTLQPLLDDGNGNGIENVIHDSQNVLLGGLAVSSMISDVQWDWKINRGPQQRTWAYCMYTMSVDTIVQI